MLGPTFEDMRGHNAAIAPCAQECSRACRALRQVQREGVDKVQNSGSPPFSFLPPRPSIRSTFPTPQAPNYTTYTHTSATIEYRPGLPVTAARAQRCCSCIFCNSGCSATVALTQPSPLGAVK